jgi:hypothetical protein
MDSEERKEWAMGIRACKRQPNRGIVRISGNADNLVWAPLTHFSSGRIKRETERKKEEKKEKEEKEEKEKRDEER